MTVSFTEKGKLEGEKQVWGRVLVGGGFGPGPQGAVISTQSGK